MDPATEEEAVDDPADGLVTVRGALGGLGLLWLAAVAAVGAVQATAYGVTTEPTYGLLGLAAGALAVTAGYGSLRAFGLT